MSDKKNFTLDRYLSVFNDYVRPLSDVQRSAAEVYFLQFAFLHQESMSEDKYQELFSSFYQMGQGAPNLKLTGMYGQYLIDRLREASTPNVQAHYRMALDVLLEFLLSLSAEAEPTGS